MRPHSGGRRRLRVGILDLLADAAPRGWDRIYAAHFRRQFVSIMPQAVAVWCRELGHDTVYATYYGQAPPHTLVPPDVDVMAELKDLRRILAALDGDAGMRAFHAGRSAELPQFYQQRFDQMLGDYAPLLSREDRLPLLAAPVPA